MRGGKRVAPEYWLCEGDPPTTGRVTDEVNDAYIGAKQQLNMDVYIALQGGGVALVMRKPIPLSGLWHIGGALSFGSGVSSFAEIAIATLLRETTLTAGDIRQVAQPRVRFHKTSERPNKDVNLDMIVWVANDVLEGARVTNMAKYEASFVLLRTLNEFNKALDEQEGLDRAYGSDPTYRRVALETVWDDVHAGKYLVW